MKCNIKTVIYEKGQISLEKWKELTLNFIWTFCLSSVYIHGIYMHTSGYIYAHELSTVLNCYDRSIKVYLGMLIMRY
jgi:hypothetical protein